MTDWKGDSNLNRVANIAADLAERYREEDPLEIFAELVNLCHNHPAKAAQLIGTFAIWFDPNQTTGQLTARAESITEARRAAQLGRTA